MSVVDGHRATANSSHVPAWKRLGLKLKYAKDTAEKLPIYSNHLEPDCTALGGRAAQKATDTPGYGGQHDPTSKERRTPAQSFSRDVAESVVATTPTSGPPSVKRGSENSHLAQPNAEPAGAFRGEELNRIQTQLSLSTYGLESDPGQQVKGKDRRKSVTFTPETKQEDGFSASVLFKQLTSDQNLMGTAALPPIDASPGSKKSERKKKKIRNLAKASTSQPADKALKSKSMYIVSSNTDQAPPYLEYIRTFYEDRKSWKFNKNRQNEVIKNAFNIYRTPAEFNSALLAYISGLQGLGARQRLIESATAVLKEITEKDPETRDIESMESEEARRIAYNNALQRQIEKFDRAGQQRNECDDQQLEELRQDVERGKRAEAILEQLLLQQLRPVQEKASEESLPSSARVENGEAPALLSDTPKPETISKRKKRKSRTQVSDSSSDSESSSSKSEGGYKPSRGPSTVHEALTVRPVIKLDPQPGKMATPSVKRGHVFFDDNLLDKMFPKKQKASETAPHDRKGKGH